MSTPPSANASSKLMSSVNAFSQKLNPLGQKFVQSVSQVRQLAAEKMGTAEDVTPLPEDYLELERQFDNIRDVYQQLIKVTRVYVMPAYDYHTQLQDSVASFSKTLTDQLSNLSLLAGEKPSQENVPVDEAPKSLPNAVAKAALGGSEKLSPETPLGAALKKYGTLMDNLGNSRQKMDAEIGAKFYQPMLTALRTNMDFSLRARRNVHSSRLTLDSCKARLRTAKPERWEAVKNEVEQAEVQLVTNIEEACKAMKAVVESPEPLRNLADMVAAQLAHYKECYEALADLAPEIDEIQVTQEALYRNSKSQE